MSGNAGFFGQATGAMDFGTNSPEYDAPQKHLDSKIPGTSEILFLKRLLYLKASIDNEVTLNAMSVPFEQEKQRDVASPDQLMLDTQVMLSGGRNSAHNFPDENPLALPQSHPKTAGEGTRPKVQHNTFLTSSDYTNMNQRMSDHMDLGVGADQRNLKTAH